MRGWYELKSLTSSFNMFLFMNIVTTACGIVNLVGQAVNLRKKVLVKLQTHKIKPNLQFFDTHEHF